MQAWPETHNQISLILPGNKTMATRPRLDVDEIDSILQFEHPHASTPPDRLFGAGIAMVDALVIIGSGLAVLSVRFGAAPPFVPSSDPAWQHHFGVLLVFAVLAVLMSNAHGLYEVMQRRSALDEAMCLLRSIVLAALFLTAFLYFERATQVSRLVVGCIAVVGFCNVLAWRLVKRNLVHRQMISGYGCRNVLVLGAGRTARELSQYLDKNPQLGRRVCGFLDDQEENRLAPGVLGRIVDFDKAILKNFVDEVVITIPMSLEAIRRVVLLGRERRVGVKVVPEWPDGLGWSCRVQQWGDFPLINLHERDFPAVSLAVKRLIDIIFSACALVLFAPVFLGVAVVIKLDSNGGVFYRSKRVGRRGLEFDCFKFRTMLPGAEKLQLELERLNERSSILFKMTNDPRVTPVGRWLRKYSIDEIPQFWNVLKGDMSIVGPRPPIPNEVRRYELEHLKRIDMTPGMTGLWQITARCNPSFHRYVQCDLEYAANWSLKLDLQIMLKTIPVVLKGTGQ
jgi:exopolysaccharide biosynthesis polyprenyl glycosylphosphotransferase